MGIQINGNTDTISAIDGGLTVSGADFTGVSAGTTAAPSISPTGDSNTGIFFPSADTVAIAEGGTEVVRVHSLGRVLVGTANTNIAGAPSNKGAKQFIYTTEGNGEWALQARHDSTTGNGLFVRAGNNSTTYTARFTGYDENNVHLNIDGLGRVTMPYQPYFYADMSSDFTTWVPNNQTQAIVYNRATINIGNHYNTTTGLFTAPVAGVYQFYVGVYSELTSFEQIWYVLNGVRSTSFVSGVNSINQPGAFFVKLSANDTVGIHPYVNDGNNRTITGNGYHTFFYGHLIG